MSFSTILKLTSHKHRKGHSQRHREKEKREDMPEREGGREEGRKGRWYLDSYLMTKNSEVVKESIDP